MEDPAAQGGAREHLKAAAAGIEQVKRLLSVPSPKNADESAEILRAVEVRLGCAAALLKQNGARGDSDIRWAVEELQGEVAVLARFLSEADKLFSGWLRALQSKRGGYTQRGQAAPLILVGKVTVEG